MLEIITQEQRNKLKTQTSITEWLAKSISMMFAVMADNDKSLKAVEKMVQKMRLPLEDEDTPVDDRPFEEVVEHGAKVNLDKQPSAAQFMRMFGQPPPKE